MKFSIYRFAMGMLLFFTALVGIGIGYELLLKKKPQETPPPNTFIVSKSGEGQYKSINEAVKAAQPGMQLLVRPGVYREKIILDKEVEIIADLQGSNKEVIIENVALSCIEMKAEKAVVRGLKLRLLPGLKTYVLKLLQARNDVEEPCIDITNGNLLLENCEISSEAVAGIGVHGSSAKPTIRHCKISGGNANGLWFVNEAGGIVEDCEIFNTTWAAVRIEYKANPTIRRCKIHDIKNGGIVAVDEAQGNIEDCEIFRTEYAGIEVRENSQLSIKKSKIYDSGSEGIWFRINSTGSVEDTEIFNNRNWGIYAASKSTPLISKCMVHDNGHSNINLNEEASSVITKCKIYGGPGSGLALFGGSKATVEDCDIFAHKEHAGFYMADDTNVLMRGCKIYDNNAEGVFMAANATGTFEHCEIMNNQSTGFWETQKTSATISHCKISGNGRLGIAVQDESSVIVEKSDLRANNWDALRFEPTAKVTQTENQQ